MLKKMPAWSLAALYWAWPGDGLEGVAWIAWSLILNLEHLQTLQTPLRSPEIDAAFCCQGTRYAAGPTSGGMLEFLVRTEVCGIDVIKKNDTQG